MYGCINKWIDRASLYLMKREVPYTVVCNFCNRLFIIFIGLAIYHFLFIQNRDSVSVVSVCLCLCTYFYIFLFLPLSLLSQMSLPSELGLMTHVYAVSSSMVSPSPILPIPSPLSALNHSSVTSTTSTRPHRP